MVPTMVGQPPKAAGPPLWGAAEPIMGGLGMYFKAFPWYVRLFGYIFDPSNAHQDDEAISSLKIPITTP